MLWQLENDERIVPKKQYFQDMVEVTGRDRALMVVRVKKEVPMFTMGHQTAIFKEYDELPESLMELIDLTTNTFESDTPFVFLVICGPGYPIQRHLHKDFLGVSSMQPIVIVSEDPVEGVVFGNNSMTLSTNRALINTREWHWVEPQKTATIWVSILAGKF